ncbi:MAG: glycosyl transferase family 90 [Pontiella sp.]
MEFISKQRCNKVRFYTKGFSQHLLVPKAWFRSRLAHKLAKIEHYDSQPIHERVNYYNKIETPFNVSPEALDLKSIPLSKKSAYYYDMRALLRHYPASVRIDYKFGDVRNTAVIPTLVKSRAIAGDNDNNILLKLNQVRHFLPIEDNVCYEGKRDLLVWRGGAKKQWRKDFLRDYWNHPLCNVGMVNGPRHSDDREEWMRPKMSIAEQLQYKFILSMEGNDVATNLKWIAQSNSLCFMTRPKFETWMMEGHLIGGKHYVELRDDYADLAEKIEYFTSNPDAAKEMIRNFQDYYRQFTNSELEELISLMVVKKYLECSGQA